MSATDVQPPVQVVEASALQTYPQRSSQSDPFAAVAQLAERVTCNLEVGGSNPPGGFLPTQLMSATLSL